MEWKKERHIFMELHSDASLYKWGGVIHVQPEKQEIYDFCSEEEKKFPIMVLEAMALLKVLRAAKGQIKGQRVDAKVDNVSLYHAFYNEGCKSRELNGVLKDLFNFLLENDVVLNLAFVSSENNLADAPSRVLKKSDAMFSKGTWEKIQQAFGGNRGHSIDMMALDSNCMIDKTGKPLKHFTPFWTSGSLGVNVFSQYIDQEENCYVFPPFNLLVPIIKFIEECQINCTVVVPASDLTPVWMPLVAEMTKDALLLGLKGQKGILLYPSKKVTPQINLAFLGTCGL